MTIDNISEKKGVPEGIWTKCKKCDYILLQKDFEENLMVCPKCGYCTRLSARKRIEFTVDKGSFKEMDEAIQPVNCSFVIVLSLIFKSFFVLILLYSPFEKIKIYS
ncbi:MAG: hypothetical protein Pg6B_11150 [Candidatus Azobacteroides pseudotrichonymphae]|nr:MAG: hypothetical protein Pg6B_11150 [Candidatus Azobacteroides pseudotrichonymphae]